MGIEDLQCIRHSLILCLLYDSSRLGQENKI